MSQLDDQLNKESAFPCPIRKRKVHIGTECWKGGCGESSYHYNERGQAILYCPMDCMGERELVSGKITRDN